MELARPIGGTNTSTNPSIFDVSAHEGTLAILKRLSSSRALKVALFCADLVGVAWGGGRVTELLFGLQRQDKSRLRRLCTFTIEVLWEEYGSRIKGIPGLVYLDVLFKLLYITGDSESYGLLHRLLFIKYTQSAPNEGLRWTLFLGQLLLNLHSQLSQKRPNVIISIETPPALPPSSSSSRPGICPACCRSFSGRDCLFMRPEKGILHCSLECLGQRSNANIVTVYL